MSRRPRSCYRLSDAIQASCVALLREGKTAKQIRETLDISAASVYAIRVKNGLPSKGRTHRSHVTAADDRREGMPTCEWCHLLAPCTCTGPDRAENHLGRRDEPVVAALTW
jgi:hypothetical protein